MGRWRRYGGAALVALALIGPGGTSATAQEQVVAPVRELTAISAYRGHIAWSERDEATGRWRLVHARGGELSVLPVPPRTVPFDADLGPDRRGRPTAVYSRCRREPAFSPGLVLTPDWMRAGGCDLYRLRLGAPREQRIRAVSSRRGSETTPSIWRGRLAFARRSPRRAAARLYVRTGGRKRPKRLRGGTIGRCVPRGCAGVPRPYAGPDTLDLGRRSLAVLWRLTNGNVIGTGVGWELRLNPLAGHRSFLVASGYVGGACGFALPVSPNAADRSVYFLDRAGDCTTARTLVTEVRPRAQSRREAQPATGFAYSIARDGRNFYWMRGPRPEADGNDPGSACRTAPGACAVVLSPNFRLGPAATSIANPPTF